MATPPSSTRQQLDDLDALLQKMLNLPITPTEEATLPPPPPPPASRIDMPSTAQFATQTTTEEPLPPPPPQRTQRTNGLPSMTFSGRPPTTTPATQTSRPVVPPTVPPTVFDSSWKVEIPSSSPPPPPSIFQGWTTETDPLAGPPRRPKTVTQRQPVEEALPSESQIINFASPLSDTQREVQPEPIRYSQPPRDLPVPIVPPPPVVVQAPPEPVLQPVIPIPPVIAPVVAMPVVPSSIGALPFVWFNAVADFFLRRFGPPGRFLTTNAGRNLLGWTGILLTVAAIGLGVCDYLGIEWTR